MPRELECLFHQVMKDLPEGTVDFVKELITQGEWGIALEVICDELHEFDVPITQECYRLAEVAAEKMQMPSTVWSKLLPLVGS